MKSPQTKWAALVNQARADKAPPVNSTRLIEAFRQEQLKATPQTWLTELVGLFGSTRLQLNLCLGGLIALIAALLLGIDSLAKLQGDSWVALFAYIGGFSA